MVLRRLFFFFNSFSCGFDLLFHYFFFPWPVLFLPSFSLTCICSFLPLRYSTTLFLLRNSSPGTGRTFSRVSASPENSKEILVGYYLFWRNRGMDCVSDLPV